MVQGTFVSWYEEVFIRRGYCVCVYTYMYTFWLIICLKIIILFQLNSTILGFNMCAILDPIMASELDFTYMISPVQERNRSVLPLNHETEVCVKKGYTIRTYTEYMKLSTYRYNECIAKDKFSLRTFLPHYFEIPCEICTVICTTCSVLGRNMASQFDFTSSNFGVTDNNVKFCYLSPEVYTCE
jgi:hypothetical protein